MSKLESSDDEEGSGSDWEEVAEDEYHHVMAQVDKHAAQSATKDGEIDKEQQLNRLAAIPEEGLLITVPRLMGAGKRGKKKNDIIGNYIIREINKCKKEVQIDLHRVSLLCTLSRGLQINNILSSEIVLGVALSTLPSERSYPPKNVDLSYFEKFLKWFRSNFKVINTEADDEPVPAGLEQLLLVQMGQKKPSCYTFLVFMFITILRALGVQVRMVWNLYQLIPMRPGDLLKLLTDESENPENKRETSKKGKESPSSSKSATPKTSKGKKKPASDSTTSSDSEDSEGNSEQKVKPKPGINQTRKNTRKAVTSKEGKDKPSASKKSSSLKAGKNWKHQQSLDSDDSNFEPQEKVKPSQKGRPKKSSAQSKLKLPKNTGRKVISSSDEEVKVEVKAELVAKVKRKYNYWSEVYLEEEERWVSVDLLDGKILCDSVLEARASQPLSYVISFSNNGHVKDVTQRYATQWMTTTQKGRDNEWWEETLIPFRGRKTKRDKAEDEFLEHHLRSLPIPKSIQELKGHPFFALRRHLLKFEAIYPDDTAPCGFIKDEAVYPRSAVHTLNGRENWVRKAKVVRIGEEPYKIVKARPKYDRVTRNVLGDRPLELFGEWQVEDYQCPVASDGKVPRNEYGNVELYLEKMLPIGTVHLRLPGLNRVAKKLGIDCANAMVGFDFHSGFTHPTYDGFVVCTEHKEILLDAWNQEQDEMKKKEEVKREQRIIQNWARLCRGLLIRQRLETRYSYNLSGKRKTEKEDESTPKKRKSK